MPFVQLIIIIRTAERADFGEMSSVRTSEATSGMASLHLISGVHLKYTLDLLPGKIWDDSVNTYARRERGSSRSVRLRTRRKVAHILKYVRKTKKLIAFSACILQYFHLQKDFILPSTNVAEEIFFIKYY